MTGDIQELDEILFEAIEAAATYTHNVTAEEADYIQNKAKQAILDWHNKQIEEVLEGLIGEQETEQKAVDGEVITYVLLSTIEAERNKLKESSSV